MRSPLDENKFDRYLRLIMCRYFLKTPCYRSAIYEHNIIISSASTCRCDYCSLNAADQTWPNVTHTLVDCLADVKHTRSLRHNKYNIITQNAPYLSCYNIVSFIDFFIIIFFSIVISKVDGFTVSWEKKNYETFCFLGRVTAHCAMCVTLHCHYVEIVFHSHITK